MDKAKVSPAAFASLLAHPRKPFFDDGGDFAQFAPVRAFCASRRPTPMLTAIAHKEPELLQCTRVELPVATEDSLQTQFITYQTQNSVQSNGASSGVADRLVIAAKHLPRSLRFIVFDGWRTYQLQKELYDGFWSRLAKENPALPPEDLDKLVRRYVSAPSKNPSRPSPHLTGGAVDLTIKDSNGELLDMGTEWDAFTLRSRTRYYENRGKLTRLSAQDRQRRESRRLLHHAMINAGFTNCPEEWWHFDYGNQFWGKVSNQSAIYGNADL